VSRSQMRSEGCNKGGVGGEVGAKFVKSASVVGFVNEKGCAQARTPATLVLSRKLHGRSLHRRYPGDI
jgi:hypothetical protein